MIQYKQETKYDCGIRALSFATQIPFCALKRLWNWKDYGDFRDNLKDSHWQHFCVLTWLNIKYRLVSLEDILAGRCVKDKTVILFHFKESPYLQQHWTVLNVVTEHNVYLWWGDGSIRIIPINDFKQYFNSGWPTCAYEVGEGETTLRWYQKLYCSIINFFI